jgi:uncharacterized protein (TIGR02001 family)
MNKVRLLSMTASAALLTLAGVTHAGEWSANAGVSSNYLWRGLTQTENEAAVSGGIDYVADSGFYVGTWASNVNYAAGDVFSYEHDLYAGFSGEAGSISYDVGYLYYNYDSEAEFDFGEVYASISVAGFTLGTYLLANTEADEGEGQSFDFADTYYLYADYAFEIRKGLELGFHVGHHDGDFNEAFNGVPGGYTDANVSLSKDGFSFKVSKTNLDDVGADSLDNDAVKFVVSYSVDIAL